MADLRDNFDVAAPLDVTPVVDRAAAEGMGSLRRGFQVGRLATDANAWAADEASLRAAGDIAGADALRAQISANQERQAAFAPRVGRVEDIRGVGDALDWAGGQVGQGTASMIEPVGAATAVQAVGRLGRLAPGAAGKALGLAADVAAPAAAFGINQRQLKGEFVNDAVRDPALMARTSPQELNRTAELYGAGAGLLDTALPAVVGRQLTGAGLRQGLHSMGVLPRIGMEMAGEGVTEGLQTAGSHFTQGQLNPNRDSSGDASEVLNAFAGGAAGGGPFAAAGVAADTGFRRVGHTADVLGTKAGEAFDVVKGAAEPVIDKAMTKGRGWIGAGMKKAGEKIDLARDGEGNLDLAKAFDQVKEAAGDAVQRFNVSREEQSILNQDVPENVLGDDAALAAWVQDNDGKRNQLVADRLADMAEDDPAAAQLLSRITDATDVADQQAAIDEGAAHVLQNNELERLVTRAERAATVAGEVAGKAGTAIGKGAKAAGDVAVKFGKAIFDGAKAGAKKNEQGSGETLDEFEARMNQAASIAENAAAQRIQGTRFQRAPVPELVRQTALKIAQVAPKFKAKGMSTGQEMQLGQMAEDLRVGLGSQAPQVLAEMKGVAPKETHKLFDYIAEQTASANTPAGRRAREEMRRDVANQLVTMLPREHQSILMASDGAGQPMNRQWLLDTVERVADGHGTLHQRQLLQEMFGQNFDKVLEAVNGLVQDKVEESRTVDDRGAEDTATVNDEGETVEETSDFEKRQAEKTSAKNTGPKVYGFARTPTLRGSNERRDPFSPLERMSDRDRLAFENENRQREAEGLEPLAGTPVKRPALFKKDDVLSTGENAIAKKTADMERALGVSEDNGSYAVSAKSAREVMKDLGYGNAKALSLYRDYQAFLGGMKEVFRAWGNAFRDEPAERQKSEWEQLAEFVGAIDSEVFSHFIAEEYSSEYMTPLAKRINDKMFVLNGMEAWNRSMRVAATKAAVEFLQKHKALPTEHSKRWLSELGLSPQEITLDSDGRLVTDRHVLAKIKGVPLAQATEDVRAIHYAINRWVEGAVLTPNAAQRPSWSSDPRYSVLFHLKQFTYSFHQTVLKRAVKELEHGNLTPMGVFAWYIPTMIAADVTKGLIQGGGSLPAYMKGYDLGDWVMHGTQRAGLLGVGQLGVDANADVASLAGPAVEQAIDALRDPLERSTLKALPLHGIYQEAFR